MVNKGFKNLGAQVISHKLRRYSFQFPVGISIGRTNTVALKTQQESIHDIVNAFQIFEKFGVKNRYYELNISCPNLVGDITFYPSQNLDDLLSAIDSLELKRPLFIKMPIEKSNEDTLEMLKVIAKHSPAGVIFGNLQKDRHNSHLKQHEVTRFNVGHFSGKPTFERSNELIALTYKHFKDRLIIIGCGGVFCAEDAYEKIKRGATLVQMITGIIFNGPQVISQINYGLEALLKKDGYTNISQAVGAYYKN
jgi:dihydroorotate dehydrogenase